MNLDELTPKLDTLGWKVVINGDTAIISRGDKTARVRITAGALQFAPGASSAQQALLASIATLRN